MLEKELPKDAALMQKISVGDMDAFGMLYDTYWSMVYRYAYKILRDKFLTEDVVQDIFVSIWDKRETLKVEQLKSYLLICARNGAISKLRAMPFVEMQEEVVQRLPAYTSHAENLDKRDFIDRVISTIEALPYRCKEIFVLSRLNGYSISEIAKTLKISHRTVENQLHIALKHVRKTLGEDYKNILMPLIVFSICVCFVNFLIV